MTIKLLIESPELVDYQESWTHQGELQSALISGSNQEYFIFCQHPPVITYGGSTNLAKVMIGNSDKTQLQSIPIIKTNRGGNITYHGPGQLILYLIIDLKKRRQDVSWYLRTLEGIVIELLKEYQIQSFCIKGKTGVWVSNTEKICSIGVRLSRWCSMHGLAINLTEESLFGFDRILPCGLEGIKTTSIEKITASKPNKSEIIEKLSILAQARFYADFGLNYSLKTES